MDRSDSAAGDLGDWVSSTASQALGYAWTLVHHRQVAEDLVQDCYCSLLARSEKYDLLRDGKKLLYRSITNAAINWTHRQHPESSLEQLPGNHRSGDRIPADRSLAEPVEVVIQRELEQAVTAVMTGLPVQQRAAIELRSLGHSLIEIAEILNVSHGNARVLLHRARTALAEQLNPFLKGDTT